MANQTRTIAVTYAGVSSSTAANLGQDVFHDMQMKINYLEVYASSSHSFTQANAKTTYDDLVTAANFSTSPIIVDYYVPSSTTANSPDLRFGVSNAAQGLYALGADQPSLGVSFFRQEYNTYYLAGTNATANVAGPLEPVTYAGSGSHIRDMNIQSDHYYNYVAYPSSVKNGVVSPINTTEGQTTAKKPIALSFPCWSMTELTEITSGVPDTPTIKKAYKADLGNVWLFKFSLDTGAETQNLARSEIQTLGEFPRYSQGLLNAASGSVSCYLGSEVIPFDPDGGYAERLWAAIDDPNATQSTNQGVAMLKAWKAFAYSKNPKLLKDMKGQSWIVQLESPTATTNNYIYGHPTQISFSWKQIGSTDGAVIYGDGLTELGVPNQCGSRWLPIQQKKVS
jgi:hypothetical protein